MNRVIDASISSALLVPSQRNSAADAIVFGSPMPLVAPEILRQEVHHLLLKAERRGEWSAAQVAEIAAIFRRLPIRYHYDPSWVERAYELARDIGTGLFDTIYLVAAIDLDAELWTRDIRFAHRVAPRFPARVHLL